MGAINEYRSVLIVFNFIQTSSEFTYININCIAQMPNIIISESGGIIKFAFASHIQDNKTRVILECLAKIFQVYCFKFYIIEFVLSVNYSSSQNSSYDKEKPFHKKGYNQN